MVALVKIKGFVIDSLFAVDSPNSSAVGLRFFCGFRVSTFTSSTAQSYILLSVLDIISTLVIH